MFVVNEIEDQKVNIIEIKNKIEELEFKEAIKTNIIEAWNAQGIMLNLESKK